MGEVLDLCNETANAYISDRTHRAIALLLNAELNRNWSKLPHLVNEANSWIDIEFSGNFPCTHFTFDKCGDLIKPNLKDTYKNIKNGI